MEKETDEKVKRRWVATLIISICLSLGVIPLCIILIGFSLTYVDVSTTRVKIISWIFVTLIVLMSVGGAITGINSVRMVNNEISWLAAAFAVLNIALLAALVYALYFW